MIEQRRDAHRGSAGLSLTWQGLISRVRLLSRYMSVYRRLLTAGMRPLHPTASATVAGPSATATTVADKPTPPPSIRRASTGEETMTMPVTGTSGLRRSLEGGVSLPESVSQEGNGDSRDRRDGEQWGTNWVGGSSAEIRKLAEQIRTRFGREALVRNRNSTEALQASNGLLL